MAYKNSYAGILPTLNYIGTPVSKADLLQYIDSTNYSVEIKTAVMTIVVQEVDNDSTGTIKIGVNNNMVSAQGDGNKWDKSYNKYFTGVTFTKSRWFMCFDTWQHSVDFMLDRVKVRGMYIGGYAPMYAKTTINNLDTFITAYQQEWVEGRHILSAPIDQKQKDSLSSIYNHAYKYFSQSVQKKNQVVEQYVRAALSHTSANIRFFLFGK